MKIFTILCALICAGCAHTHNPSGRPYSVVATGYSVVNNTGVILDVVQDGITVYTDLYTGQVLPLRNPLWRHKTAITVLGHDEHGNYVGTATWLFISETAETWEVTRLNSPRPPN